LTGGVQLGVYPAILRLAYVGYGLFTAAVVGGLVVVVIVAIGYELHLAQGYFLVTGGGLALLATVGVLGLVLVGRRRRDAMAPRREVNASGA
jgi:hypothetical protein